MFAGFLIDGSGAPAKKNALIEIRNGIIFSIQENFTSELPVANLYDFSRGTVIPGLVDSHVHLSMSGTDNPDIRKKQLNESFASISNQMSEHIKDHIRHGVAAIRDGGDYAAHSLKFRNDNQINPKFPVSVKSPGKAWHKKGRYGSLTGRPPIPGESLGQSIMRDNVGIDHIKIINSGLNSLITFGKETMPQFTVPELGEAILISKKLKLKTMIHANGKLPVRMSIEAGCDSIEHGYFMGQDNIEKMAEKEITWVPTAYTMMGYKNSVDKNSPEYGVTERNLDHQLDQIYQALKKDVIIAAGTDSGSIGVNHGFSMKEEIKLLLHAGFSLEKAVQCATFNGAKLLGLEKDLGILRKGMPATYNVFQCGPENLPENLNKPKKVFIKGQEWEWKKNLLK